MNYSAVLFDLDGTLLDTLDDLADSTNAALGQLGLPGHPAASFRYFVGDGVENLVRRALPADRADPATIARCAALVREEYGRRWADKTRPYEGIAELLSALAARGTPMAVLSNKPDEFTRLCVERLLGRWRFAVVIGARPDVPRKPDPGGALQIAAQLGLAPGQIAYLGDTNTDMRTAVAAGMFPVGALWGFRTADELTASGARVLIQKPLDLMAIHGFSDPTHSRRVGYPSG
jgi:phosphoglycolate phosphatase